MGKKAAYISIRNLTKLNNLMTEAINNPNLELGDIYAGNTSGKTVVNYQFYKDCMDNLQNKLVKLEGTKNYETFKEFVDSFVNKTMFGKEVYGNFYLLSHLGEVASRLSMLCYRGDELGYEKPDEIIIRAAKDVAESKANGDEFSTIEPIYKEIVQTIKENLKEVNYKNMPMELKFYYDLVEKELKEFKVR